MKNYGKSKNLNYPEPINFYRENIMYPEVHYDGFIDQKKHD